MDLRREVQIVPALGLFELGLRLLQLTVDNADSVDRGFFILPLRLELIRPLLEVGQVFFQPLEPFARGLILFLLQRALLDFQLLNLTLQLIDLGRHRIQLHPQSRGCLIDQVNGLVRQETVGDVPM